MSEALTAGQTSTSAAQRTAAAAPPVHNSTSTSMSSDEGEQPPPKPLPSRKPISTNFLTVAAFDREICSDLRRTERASGPRPARPRVPKRNRFDFGIIDGHLISSVLPEKRLSDPQIRYAFYNKGFEVAASCRKFSLTQLEMRRSAMPHITEYGSFEDEDGDAAEWAKNCVSNDVVSHGSSGRDITLLPKLKVRICDEMGKQIEGSLDESTPSPDEKPAANGDHCPHSPRGDPFCSDDVQVNENFRRCTKCGHFQIRKQFTNAFLVE